MRWLRFLGMLKEPHATQHAHAGEVTAFAAQMRNERGWAEETIRGCCHTVDRFFDWLDERGVALASVRITDIDRAVARWHARDCSRLTIHDYAQRLRTFFRFAERQGWCTPGLADGIMPSRFHPGETVPKGLTRVEVLRLLATTEGERPADIRDRAIRMLLIAYGSRSGEVAGLRLDDLDWEEETLRARCPKPGRTHHYPLSRGVGQPRARIGSPRAYPRTVHGRKLRSGCARPAFPAPPAPQASSRPPSDHLTRSTAVAAFCSALRPGFPPPLTPASGGIRKTIV